MVKAKFYALCSHREQNLKKNIKVKPTSLKGEFNQNETTVYSVISDI